MQNGQGKLTKKNKDVYEGSFATDCQKDLSSSTYTDGSKFRGSYHNGKRNGTAVEESASGVRFEGNYRDDCRDGKFIERDKNGMFSKRYYENGKRYTNQSLHNITTT